jgi:hypothetical protein
MPRESAPANNDPGTAMVRQCFGETEIQRQPETAATAVAAQASAAIQARYIMALQHPRDLDIVRDRLLHECERPNFAKVAWYHKPIGKGVEGPSIRFAEAAMRCMGNLLAESAVVYDDAEKRIIRCMVTDLESNTTYPRDIVIDKVVERSKVGAGQVAIRSRINSQGNRTYLVPATEDDLLNKQGALESKALRTLILRIIPGDIVDEAKTTIQGVLHDKAAKDPDGERKALLDGFSALNVPIAELKEWVGHDLGSMSPAEIVDARATWAAIRDGQTTWSEVIEERRASRAPAAPFADFATPPPPAQAVQPAPLPPPADPAKVEPTVVLSPSMAGQAPDELGAKTSAARANDLLVAIRACQSALGLAGLRQQVMTAATAGEIGEKQALQLREEVDSRLSAGKSTPKRQ